MCTFDNLTKNAVFGLTPSGSQVATVKLGSFSFSIEKNGRDCPTIPGLWITQDAIELVKAAHFGRSTTNLGGYGYLKNSDPETVTAVKNLFNLTHVSNLPLYRVTQLEEAVDLLRSI